MPEDRHDRTRTLVAAIRERYGVDVILAGARTDDGPAGALAVAAEVGRQLGDRCARGEAPAPIWAPLPAASCPAPAGDRGKAVQGLAAWAVAHGAWLEPVELCIEDVDQCTVRARRAIAAGERVLSVPGRLLITPEVLTAHEGGLARSGLPPCRPADALSVVLSRERARGGSPWRPVLAALPAVSDLPHQRTDLEALAGTSAWTFAAAACQRIAALHEQLAPALASAVSLADLAWGHGVVQSRAFTLPIDGEMRCAIVPLVDLLDHGVGDTRLHHDEATGDWVVVATRAFAPGERMFLDYGPIGNGRMLVNYGFTLTENPHDIAELVFPVADDPRVDVVGHLLWGLPFGRPASVVVRAYLDDQMQLALSIARLRAAPFDELEGATFVGRLLPWLGPELERHALAHLAAAARASIARLEREPPAAATVSDWQRACDDVRRGERAVLDRVLALACHPDDAGDALRSAYLWGLP